MNIVDQRRAANTRRIERMGGLTADDVQQVEVVMPGEDPDEVGAIRDAAGHIVRRL